MKISWRAAFVFQAVVVVIIILLGRRITDPLPADPTRPFDAVGAVPGAPRIDRLRQYFNHPGFVEPDADGVRAALAGLFAFGDPTFTSVAVGGIATVLVALAAALTLIPALLAMWGAKLKPARRPITDDGFFGRLSRVA